MITQTGRTYLETISDNIGFDEYFTANELDQYLPKKVSYNALNKLVKDGVLEENYIKVYSLTEDDYFTATEEFDEASVPWWEAGTPTHTESDWICEVFNIGKQ